MDDLSLRRFSTPITTGIPQTIPTDLTETVPEESFQEILKEQLGEPPSPSGVNFSKHAMNRVLERGIDLSPDSLSRLNEGVKLAEEKGLDDTLILVGSEAFIVSVRNNTVITTIPNEELQGNVFTNIEGTVII